MLNNIRNKPTKELYKTQSYVLNLALYIWLFLTHVRSVPIKNYTSTFEVKSFHSKLPSNTIIYVKQYWK